MDPNQQPPSSSGNSPANPPQTTDPGFGAVPNPEPNPLSTNSPSWTSPAEPATPKTSPPSSNPPPWASTAGADQTMPPPDFTSPSPQVSFAPTTVPASLATEPAVPQSESTPTFTPPQPPPTSSFPPPPTETPAAIPPLPPPPMPETTEPAPTDLSQLTGISSESQAAYVPPVASQENLVVPPPTGIPEGATATIPEEHHKLPIWLIIGGVVVILLVVAASYYFFFTGKPNTTTSLPATQQTPLTNPPKPIQPTSAPISSQSATFGNSSLGNLSGASSSSTTVSGGSSAIDTLRARQNATSSGTTR